MRLLAYGFLNVAPYKEAPEPLRAAGICINQALVCFTENQNQTKEQTQKIAHTTLGYLDEFNTEGSLKNLATNIGFLGVILAVQLKLNV